LFSLSLQISEVKFSSLTALLKFASILLPSIPIDKPANLATDGSGLGLGLGLGLGPTDIPTNIATDFLPDLPGVIPTDIPKQKPNPNRNSTGVTSGVNHDNILNPNPNPNTIMPTNEHTDIHRNTLIAIYNRYNIPINMPTVSREVPADKLIDIVTNEPLGMSCKNFIPPSGPEFFNPESSIPIPVLIPIPSLGEELGYFPEGVTNSIFNLNLNPNTNPIPIPNPISIPIPNPTSSPYFLGNKIFMNLFSLSFNLASMGGLVTALLLASMKVRIRIRVRVWVSYSSITGLYEGNKCHYFYTY
jgi:hypothetical protein